MLISWNLFIAFLRHYFQFYFYQSCRHEVWRLTVYWCCHAGFSLLLKHSQVNDIKITSTCSKYKSYYENWSAILLWSIIYFFENWIQPTVILHQNLHVFLFSFAINKCKNTSSQGEGHSPMNSACQLMESFFKLR